MNFELNKTNIIIGTIIVLLSSIIGYKIYTEIILGSIRNVNDSLIGSYRLSDKMLCFPAFQLS